MSHVADATTFFTDLHHILRVIAAGNIRTLCHHRLVLLEQVVIFIYLKLRIYQISSILMFNEHVLNSHSEIQSSLDA